MLLGRLPGALKAFEILLKIDRGPSVAKGCASFIVIFVRAGKTYLFAVDHLRVT